MAFVTEYRNGFDKPVSNGQIATLDAYQELIIDTSTSKIKRVNFYDSGILKFIEYYIDVSETESSVVSGLSVEVNSISIVYATSYPTYMIEVIDSYHGGQLTFRSRYLLRGPDRICWEDLDLVTSAPRYENTRKYCCDADDVEILSCDYNADGSVNTMLYKPLGDLADEHWESFDAATFSDLQAHFRSDMSYYLTAVLEPQSA